MRAKTKYRRIAERLRREGKSYSEIRQRIPVAKSSLSLWLRDISLTEAQGKRLAQLNSRGQQAGAEARRKQRLDKLQLLRLDVQKQLPELVQDEFFTFGLALYMAEGAKQKPWNLSQRVDFGNTDERLILLMRQWFTVFCEVDSEKFRYRLHIHESADVRKATSSWAQLLNIKAGEIAVTLKKHTSTSRHVTEHYKGLISLRVVRSTWLNRRIDLWAQGVSRNFLKES